MSPCSPIYRNFLLDNSGYGQLLVNTEREPLLAAEPGVEYVEFSRARSEAPKSNYYYYRTTGSEDSRMGFRSSPRRAGRQPPGRGPRCKKHKKMTHKNRPVRSVPRETAIGTNPSPTLRGTCYDLRYFVSQVEVPQL